MEAVTNSVVGETLFRHRLESGLSVVVLPKPGFQKTYATFATHYGSIDSHFRLPDTGEEVEVPDGIAHFLEHKMFEKEDGGDVFDDFARFGASANAYTDYTTTTYLFSTTAHVPQNLTTLLDFVQRPYFTDANVEKEKGIIEQEIRMYLDMPGDRLHSNLMRALYQAHPARIDIAGTVASIRTITPETLYQCYRTFYHPSNMVVLVVGDVEPERVIDQVVDNQARKHFGRQGPIGRIFPEEPPLVAQKRIGQAMPVAAPLFLMGYKDVTVHGPAAGLWRHEVAAGLMWQMLLGRSSPLFDDLYKQGLINDRFAARYGGGDTFGLSTIGGETPDPDRLENILLERLGAEPLTAESLERQRKREMGDIIRLFQNPEDFAYAFNSLYFRGIDILAYLDTVEAVTLDEVEALRAEQLNEALRAVSLVTPQTS